MVLNTALTSMIGMSLKTQLSLFNKFYSIFLMGKICLTAALLILSSCRMPTNFGFYQPITMDMNVPDGPPEFKAGWRDGCRSGLANGNFLNSDVYLTEEGASFSPVYTHDGQYRSAWGNAYWVCITYGSTFVSSNSMQFGPLK